MAEDRFELGTSRLTTQARNHYITAIIVTITIILISYPTDFYSSVAKV